MLSHDLTESIAMVDDDLIPAWLIDELRRGAEECKRDAERPRLYVPIDDWRGYPEYRDEDDVTIVIPMV